MLRLPLLGHLAIRHPVSARTGAALACLVLIVSACAAVAAPAPKRALECRKTRQPIRVDGDIDEWFDADLVRLHRAAVEARARGDVGDSSDLAAVIRALWDEEYLYIAAEVTDDTVHTGPGLLDGLALYFDLEHDGDVDSTFAGGDHAIFLAADPDAPPGARRWLRGSDGGATEREAPEVRLAVRPTYDGYVLEAAVPLGERGLGGGADLFGPPHRGCHIGFAFAVLDVDGPQAVGRGPVKPSELNWWREDDRESTWGDLVFVDPQDPLSERPDGPGGSQVWTVYGPLGEADDAALDIQPEMLTPVPGRGGWSDPVRFSGQKLDLSLLFGKVEAGIAYAFCQVRVSDDGPATLDLGSDEGLRVWFNGQKAADFNGERNHHLPNERVPVALIKGDNAILVRVTQSRGPFGFSVNLTPSEDDATYAGRIVGATFHTPGKLRQRKLGTSLSDEGDQNR